MIDRPIRLRLHPCEIVEAASPLIKHKALTIEIHRKEIANPTLIDRANQRMIAETPRIRMHQDMCLRHIAEFILIDITQAHVIIAHTRLHMAFALRRKIILVADVIHQIVIVTSSEVGAHHIKPQRIDFPNKIIVAIEHIDVFQTVSVCPHLPE